MIRVGRRPLVLLLSAAAALSAAPTASAGPLVSLAPSCGEQRLTQPFLRWLDPASYVLVPEGALEGAARGWTRSRASLVRGNEPYFVNSPNDVQSLKLPAGSSATTPAVCVGIEHPTLRLFVRNQGSVLSRLKVEVLFEDALGRARALTIANLLAGPSFSPTLPLPIVANLLPLLPGGNTAVAFRFTPQGSGDWRIDDLYVDPPRRN